jgi:hypothetical protein
MHRFGERTGWFVLLAVFVSLVAAAPASAGTKPYTVVFPTTVSSGTPFTATITNKAHQSLGSVNLTAPSGLTVIAASLPKGSPGTVTVSGNVVQLRNLKLASGQSVTLTMTVTVNTPGGACPTSFNTWMVQAKQANNFNGNGNDFTLDTANSVLTTGPASCQTTSPDGNDTATITATGGTATASWNTGSDPVCAGYTPPQPDWLSFDVSGAAAKTVTLVQNTPASLEPPFGEDDPIQVCFAAPYQFTTASGQPAQSQPPDSQPPNFVGLLPRCPVTPDGPCISKTNDDDVKPTTSATVEIPAGLTGDPRMH